jgi:glycerol-3-phosphate dehydrogenase
MQIDVVIVGGGIHGAGVAQAAVAAGQSVLLLEKFALGHGTSSRSSKLIHGGLRYLESGQFRLVRESLTERAIMLKVAPDLVRLQPFYVPIYPTTHRRPWQLRLGLALYAALGGFGPGTSFGTLPRSQWDQLDGLDTHELRSVFRYYDGQTDDAALTRAVVRSALQLGLQVAAPAEFIAAECNVDGVEVHYTQDGVQRSCRARVLVNAAGPWANSVLARVTPALPQRSVELVQGTHIALPGEVRAGIYYVEAPSDARAVFVMPWHGKTLVGTTETPFHGNPEDVKPLDSEVQYLLAVLHRYFPAHRESTRAQISDAFAGLRVLPAGTGRAFSRSRETMFDVDRRERPRVLTIYGGKLTGWRAAAEQVWERIAPSLPSRPRIADTKEMLLEPER